MWHILKTELHYHKGFFLVIGIPLVILAFAWAHPWPLEPNTIIRFRRILSGFGFCLAFGLAIATLSSLGRERRGRQRALLPMTPRRLGITRVVFGIFPCLILGVCSYLSMVVSGSESPVLIVWKIGYLIGLVLSFNAVLMIAGDLLAHAANTYRTFSDAAVIPPWLSVGILLLGIFLLMQVVKGNYNSALLIASLSNVMTFNLLGLVLSLLSIVTFIRRKSYLE